MDKEILVIHLYYIESFTYITLAIKIVGGKVQCIVYHNCSRTARGAINTTKLATKYNKIKTKLEGGGANSSKAKLT